MVACFFIVFWTLLQVWLVVAAYSASYDGVDKRWSSNSALDVLQVGVHNAGGVNSPEFCFCMSTIRVDYKGWVAGAFCRPFRTHADACQRD